MKLPKETLQIYIDCYNSTNNEQIAEYIRNRYEIDITNSDKEEVCGLNN